MYKRCAKRFSFALLMLLLASPVLSEPIRLSVEKAQAIVDPVSGRPVLNVQLTPESRKAFAAFTTANVGKQIVLKIDGKIIVTPIVREPILVGTLQISGDFDTEDLQGLATRIGSGASKVETDVKAD